MFERNRLRQQLVCVGLCLAANGCLPEGQIQPETTSSPSGNAAGRGPLSPNGVAGVTATPIAGAAASGVAGSAVPIAGSPAAGSRAPAAGSGGRSGGTPGSVVAGGTGGGGAGGTGGTAGGSTPATSTPGDTWKAKDGALYDSCGEKVVLRGINHPTLYVDRKGDALTEIAKTGANAVRLFWYAKMGVKISEAESAISNSIKNGMVPILEMHDSTCKWDLDPIVSYWTSAEAVNLIKKYQSHLIVNIANETSPPSANEFKSKYSDVVNKLRSAGIHVPLMIDGGNCGRDYNVLLSQGEALVAADPDHNLIFSGHLYDRMNDASYGKLFTDAAAKKLTFVVGEFAHKQPPGCGSMLDYTALISQADKNGVGWLAWSWGDNDPNTDWNSDCGEFDMATTFSFDTLRGWGKEVAVSLPASIENTAVRPKSLVMGACQ
jgi:mannan endo-1,4-beta-mannosidase